MYVNSCNLYYETPYRGKSLQEIYYLFIYLFYLWPNIKTITKNNLQSEMSVTVSW